MSAQKPLRPQVRLRRYREFAVGSTEQLAQRIEEHGLRVHPNHLRNYELGHQRPSDRPLVAWVKARGLNPLDVWLADAEAVRDEPSAGVIARPTSDTVDAWVTEQE